MSLYVTVALRAVNEPNGGFAAPALPIFGAPDRAD
jgi:hypothetical protein